MVRALLVLALSAVAPLAAAQSIQLPPLPFNLPFKPDLSKVSADTRSNWCDGERAVCGTLCGVPNSFPTKNDCSPSTLEFACTCQNGSAPGLQYYQNSLPTFICQEAFKQCNAANVGNSTGQNFCEKDVRGLCGTLPLPAKVGGGGATSSSAPSSSATQTGSATTPSTTSRPDSAAAVNQLSNFASVVVAAAAILGACAL